MQPVQKCCTTGHCIWPYKPEFDGPTFEILETDTIGMKEAKRLWNCSDHECHPNYMDGKEQYRILKTYETEHAVLTKIWEEKAVHEPGLFSMYYDKIKKAEQIGKERIQILTHPKSDITKLIQQQPYKAHALTAVIVAGVAIFFFAVFFPKVATVVVPLICVGTAGLLYKFYIDSKTSSGNLIESQNNQ